MFTFILVGNLVAYNLQVLPVDVVCLQMIARTRMSQKDGKWLVNEL